MRVTTLVAVLAVLWPGTAAARAGAAPRGSAAPEAVVATALAAAPGSACRDRVRAELTSGQRREGAACDATRQVMTRAAMRAEPSRTFGVIDKRDVSLTGVRLTVSRADRCQHWVLRAPRTEIVRATEAQQAGCRVRRHEGSLAITAVAPDGTRVAALELTLGGDGRGMLSFAEADNRLRIAGYGGLDAFTQLELGRDGFAGVIDLTSLRKLLGDWHHRWVVAGRGSPRLFAVRHPDHPRAQAVQAMAVEAALARQEADYIAVARGELDAAAFLRRHAWSPYRESVIAMAFGEAPPPPLSPAEGPPAPSAGPLRPPDGLASEP